MKRSFSTLFLTLITFSTLLKAQQITTTEGLLKEMHARYHGKFYKHITFVQLNKLYRDSGQVEQSVWYEAFEYPGKLRVDFGPSVGKDGFIYLNDTVYNFKDGVVVNKAYQLNESILLSGDIYCIPIPTVLNKLKNLGYDLTKFREDKWKGKPTYVIGAEAGNDSSRQFWIDREFLYLVKLVTNDSGAVQETHYSEHQAKGKFYIEDEVKIMENGKLTKTERYAEVNPSVVLHESIFDPKHWGKVHWKSK